MAKDTHALSDDERGAVVYHGSSHNAPNEPPSAEAKQIIDDARTEINRVVKYSVMQAMPTLQARGDIADARLLSNELGDRIRHLIHCAVDGGGGMFYEEQNGIGVEVGIAGLERLPGEEETQYALEVEVMLPLESCRIIPKGEGYKRLESAAKEWFDRASK